MELFSGEDGLALAHNLSAQATRTFDPEEGMLAEKKKPTYAPPSKEEQARIRQAIKEAKTLSEIAHLEQQLAGGVIPGMGR
jgi:U2 small nuclear ribonucleoprotein A'